MGLDMYLSSVPKVESIEELHALEIRLSDAYYAGQVKFKKELKKVQEEKGFKNPIRYTLCTYLKTQKQYDDSKDRGEHWAKVELSKEMGYWRKFNALHSWFVNNCQDGIDDCQTSIVDVDILKELLFTLATVYKKNGKINKTKASEVLPTQKGFFFGGTKYDEYYVEDIENLKMFLMTLFDENNFEENTLIYHASW